MPGHEQVSIQLPTCNAQGGLVVVLVAAEIA